MRLHGRVRNNLHRDPVKEKQLQNATKGINNNNKKTPQGAFKEILTFWEKCLFTFLPRVRWEDQYHFYVCIVDTKLEVAVV